jgi:hypothetical protein
MTFTLEPAAVFAAQINHLIMEAAFDVANEWFFYDGAYNGAITLEQGMNNTLNNTWLHENFVAVNENGKIIAYFEGKWLRPMDIIDGFRMIHFNDTFSGLFVRSVFKYLGYIFVNRGCQALNWAVAVQNEHAHKQYERFVRNYCGHEVGVRHHALKSYTGKISDSILLTAGKARVVVAPVVATPPLTLIIALNLAVVAVTVIAAVHQKSRGNRIMKDRNSICTAAMQKLRQIKHWQKQRLNKERNKYILLPLGRVINAQGL